MLLPDTEAELLAKVRRLPARDDDRLHLFEVVDGVVVEVGAGWGGAGGVSAGDLFIHFACLVPQESGCGPYWTPCGG